MIRFTPRAGRQVRDLRQHYTELGRPEAIRSLSAALETAWQAITSNPAAGLAAPRPYPELAQPGRAWVKAGRYWVAYRLGREPLIVAVFYDTADMPRRV